MARCGACPRLAAHLSACPCRMATRRLRRSRPAGIALRTPTGLSTPTSGSSTSRHLPLARHPCGRCSHPRATKADRRPLRTGRESPFTRIAAGRSRFWASDVDGANAVQLTSLGRSNTGTPRWSPDGRHIAFDARVGGAADIFVIDPDGGPAHRLTTETTDDVVPSWSRDGRWVYFASKRTPRWEVWKVPAAGGPAMQVTKQGGFAAFESRTGGRSITRRGSPCRAFGAFRRAAEMRRRSSTSQSPAIGVTGRLPERRCIS